MLHDEFLTVEEIAEYLRVSKMTVYRMVEDGTLPSFRVGRSIRIPTDDFNKYMEAQQRGIR